MPPELSFTQILAEFRKVAKGFESSFSKRLEQVEGEVDEHEVTLNDHEARLKALEE